jgi:acyl carrier protein
MTMAQTPVQPEVAAIWKDVLNVEEVGPETDFFALGGTSLHVARVVTKARVAFGIKLAAQDLIEHPTLAGFAAQVDQALAG